MGKLNKLATKCK